MAKKFNSQNKPYIMEMKPGRYAWCTCGHSRKQPFCDGTHGETGMLPIIEIIEEPKRIAWCGCKVSENKPFCDGAHLRYKE